MRLRQGLSRLALLASSLAPVCFAQSPAAGQVRGSDIVAHLERVIGWYHSVEALSRSSTAGADVVLRDTAGQNALGALQLAFDFAHAEAAFKAASRNPSAGDDSAATTASHNMDQVAMRAAARVTSLQSRINDLDAAIAKAPQKARAQLEAQRKQLNAELNLASEIQTTIQGMVKFVGSGGAAAGASGGLSGQINDLESTVPESRHEGKTVAAPQIKTTEVPTVPQPGSEGLIALTADVISLARAQVQMRDLLSSTDALLANVDELRKPVISELRDAVNKSDQMAASSGTETIDQLAAGQKQINVLIARFKQLSAVSVPLSEEQVLIENCRGTLAEWNSAIGQQFGVLGRYLIMRAGTLVFVVLLILACSQIWRRATIRLVRDPRRQKQLLVLRRVVVGLAMTIAVILGFVTQFGSVATYAGFLTAGLAVALQNVILAVVAYFFLIGRYGVRVGDRVTIAGVTGDVIDLGLVRLYLMEYAGTGADLHPTGRVVVFSNAVLFQPQAIYKQLPGTDYVWHTVTLTLAPETNFQEAEQRLKKAMGAVYDHYRSAIEQKHAELERSVEMRVEAPQPDCQLRFTDGGLEFKGRYPADLSRASDIDEQVLKALHEEVTRDPELKFAPSGMPKIHSEAA